MNKKIILIMLSICILKINQSYCHGGHGAGSHSNATGFHGAGTTNKEIKPYTPQKANNITTHNNY